MEERKIIKFGNSSYIITLPFEWMKKNNLGKGDKLNLMEMDKSIILSKGSFNNEKRAQIDISDQHLKTFNRELISYYLKNYRYIKIIGNNIIEKLDEIKVLKEKLSSVEITEIQKDYVILKDLTAASELDVKSLIKEIVEMEKIFFDELMVRDNGNKYYFLSNLDSNVNKLAFLAFKGLNYNLESLNDISQVRNTIYYWRIVSSIETIGDIIKRIARYLKDSSKEENHHLCNTLKDIRKYYDFVTNMLYEDVGLEENLKVYYDKKQSLLREFDTMREGFENNINLYLVISQLFKDIVGQLDHIILSVIDINTN